MNMDDLLKNIWTAEENEAVASTRGGKPAEQGNVQWQRSITFPWMHGLNADIASSDPNLDEMALEHFFTRSGMLKNDIQSSGMSIRVATYGGLLPTKSKDHNFKTGYQQSSSNKGVLAERKSVFLNSPYMGNHEKFSQQQPQPRSEPRLQLLFPKQRAVRSSCSLPHGNNVSFSSPGTKCPMVQTRTLANIQSGVPATEGLQYFATFAGRSPRTHPNLDTVVKSNEETLSLSPSSYKFGEGGPGRRSSAPVEKVAERREKRMIKNRESASRSRARKQAYTLELEAEVAKLREINQDLWKKQEEFVELRKNQTMNVSSKTRCLRRTLTAPW